MPGRGLGEFIGKFDGHFSFQHHGATSRRHLRLRLVSLHRKRFGRLRQPPNQSTLAEGNDRGVMLLPDLAKEIEVKLEDDSSSTRTQINLDPNSTRIETPLVQPIFGLRNASSTYKHYQIHL